MMASRLDAVSLLRFAASSFACVSFACLSVASLSRFIVDASLLAALAVLDRLYIACRNARSPAAPISRLLSGVRGNTVASSGDGGVALFRCGRFLPHIHALGGGHFAVIYVISRGNALVHLHD